MKKLLGLFLGCTYIIGMQTPQANYPAVLRFVDPNVFMASINGISIFRPFGSTIILNRSSNIKIYKFIGKVAGISNYRSYESTIAPREKVIHYNVNADVISYL